MDRGARPGKDLGGADAEVRRPLAAVGEPPQDRSAGATSCPARRAEAESQWHFGPATGVPGEGPRRRGARRQVGRTRPGAGRPARARRVPPLEATAWWLDAAWSRWLALAAALACCTGPEGSPPASPSDPAPAAAGAGAEPSSASATPAAPVEPAPAPEEPAPDPVERLMAMSGEESTSVGGPRDGRLTGGVALPEAGPGFRSNPRRPNPSAVYGTVEVVQSLVRAARVVHEALPGGELLINDLGFERGGPIPHHGSHRAGRDVDVLFYLIDREGEPTPSVGAFLDPRGRGFDFRALDDPRDDHLVRMDVPRTWRFVQALLEGPHADLVQRIFIVEHLRTRLLSHAERARAPRAIRDRFAEITCQPGYPHDDHLHIRYFCTFEDLAAGCEDSGPTYYWRVLQLRERGLRPVINRPRRDRPMPPQTSAEEARRGAGRMHARVEQWLARREAWAEAPHPGRRYCR